ncbi:dihydroxyacetone kinase subunit DhaK [Marispirochaeta sp.]|uniref:dihydroxyacetone kinase subunit DhaK n=1 Tax=Marispirochaeta sp. TaxID=2038653 RepID=UPI0029C97D0A|nr:dihydroxyacetone kinase subunit DhaK [Marispirochaeta sp.]
MIYLRVNQVLKEKGITVIRAYLGEFATSMEMTGFSISVFKLDKELKQLPAKPADTPFFTQIQF